MCSSSKVFGESNGWCPLPFPVSWLNIHARGGGPSAVKSSSNNTNWYSGTVWFAISPGHYPAHEIPFVLAVQQGSQWHEWWRQETPFWHVVRRFYTFPRWKLKIQWKCADSFSHLFCKGMLYYSPSLVRDNSCSLLTQSRGNEYQKESIINCRRLHVAFKAKINLFFLHTCYQVQ